MQDIFRRDLLTPAETLPTVRNKMSSAFANVAKLPTGVGITAAVVMLAVALWLWRCSLIFLMALSPVG